MQKQNYIDAKLVMRRFICIVMALFISATTLLISDISASAADAGAPSAPNKFCVEKISKTYIDLYWYSYDYADYYEVARYNSSTKKYTVVANVKSNGSSYEEVTYRVTGLKENAGYAFAVRAYRVDYNGKKLYSDYTQRITAATSPVEPVINDAEYTSQGKITVTWEKVAGVSGYIIEYSTSNKFSNDGSTSIMQVGGENSTSKTISGLAAKRYYVRMCTYNVYGGRYYCSDFSRTKYADVSSGASLKTMLNSISTSNRARDTIKSYTDNGVDIARYSTTYDKFKAIYDWHARNYKNYGWDCMGCNINFNSCIYALFEDTTMGKNSAIYLGAGSVRNNDGSVVMHKWSMIYLGGVSYIFDPRLQGYTGNYTGTDYFGITSSSSKYKMYLFDYKMFVWPGTYFNESSDTYVHSEPKPDIVKISAISARPAGLTIRWDAVSGASGYQIIYSTSSDFSNRGTMTVNDGKQTSKALTNLNSSKRYYVRVRAFKSVGGDTLYGYWSAPVNIVTGHKNEPLPASISSVTAAKNGFNVNWSAISNATGYQIQFATRSDFSNGKTIYAGDGKTTSKLVTGRAANSKYYVRVRSYRKVNGSYYYAAWSSAKYVTTK